MILDNMKFTDKESLTFVPIKLINTFCHFLDVEHPDGLQMHQSHRHSTQS